VVEPLLLLPAADALSMRNFTNIVISNYGSILMAPAKFFATKIRGIGRICPAQT
jgi:hypothetical protein